MYDLNRSTNFDFPYERYPLFDLDNMQNDKCLAEFRFHKNDLPTLAEVLGILDQFILEQRSVVEGMEALCMLLKRLTYPCRYSDMMHRFGQRNLSVLCQLQTVLWTSFTLPIIEELLTGVWPY